MHVNGIFKFSLVTCGGDDCQMVPAKGCLLSGKLVQLKRSIKSLAMFQIIFLRVMIHLLAIRFATTIRNSARDKSSILLKMNRST